LKKYPLMHTYAHRLKINNLAYNCFIDKAFEKAHKNSFTNSS